MLKFLQYRAFEKNIKPELYTFIENKSTATDTFKMIITTEHTKQEDIPAIFSLYDEATDYQKKVGNNHWLGFEAEVIAKEVDEGRHFKILLDGMIGGTFVITFDDHLIWKTWKADPAVYIHRIAISQASRGNNLVKHIIGWAKKYAERFQLRYIRIDTSSGNDRLINYYVKCGFAVTSTDSTVEFTPGLPAHYEKGIFTLLEIEVR